jgi:hypothetical protein
VGRAANEVAADLESGGYERHRPEGSLLYRTVQQRWRPFEAELVSSSDLQSLPRFVNMGFEAFLRCGILPPA